MLNDRLMSNLVSRARYKLQRWNLSGLPRDTEEAFLKSMKWSSIFSHPRWLVGYLERPGMAGAPDEGSNSQALVSLGAGLSFSLVALSTTVGAVSGLVSSGSTCTSQEPSNVAT